MPITSEEEKEASKEETKEILNFYIDYLIEHNPDKFVLSKETAESDDNDYEVTVDGSPHFIEVKTRRCNFYDYPDTIVPLRKHSTAEHYWVANHIKTGFLVKFACGTIAILDLTQEPDKVGELTRKDRWQECTHAFYNLSRFKRLTII